MFDADINCPADLHDWAKRWIADLHGEKTLLRTDYAVDVWNEAIGYAKAIKRPELLGRYKQSIELLPYSIDGHDAEQQAVIAELIKRLTFLCDKIEKLSPRKRGRAKGSTGGRTKTKHVERVEKLLEKGLDRAAINKRTGVGVDNISTIKSRLKWRKKLQK